jgi:hypothetical protein
MNTEEEDPFTIYLVLIYVSSRAILTNKDVLHQETPWEDIWKDDFWGTPLSHVSKEFKILSIKSHP